MSFLLVLSAAGCGSKVELSPVRGQVTLNGVPVGPGTVIFIPQSDDSNPLPSAMGQFGRNGQYELTTSEPGDGAVVGTHQVIIQSSGENFGAESLDVPVDAIPLFYADPSHSGLTAQVAPGANEIDFPLRRR